MGMYDEIVCNYPLPTQSPFAIYQTKSLDCMMGTYEIAEDGRLFQTDGTFTGKLDPPELVELTGVVEFYNSNFAACAFGQTFTRDGEDFESVTYEATFHDGKVTAIVEIERERTPALSSEFYRQADVEIDKDAPQIDETEPEVGATLWRLWGGLVIVYLTQGSVKRIIPVKWFVLPCLARSALRRRSISKHNLLTYLSDSDRKRTGASRWLSLLGRRVGFLNGWIAIRLSLRPICVRGHLALTFDDGFNKSERTSGSVRGTRC